MQSLQNRCAIVTGGLGALGREVCRHFLNEGARVAVPARPGTSGRELPAGLKDAGSALFIGEADLEKEDQVRSFVAKAVGQMGSVDILVALAGGFAGGGPIGTLPAATLQEMLSRNLMTTFHACSAVLPLMRAKKSGRIITIAAKPALIPTANRAAYAIAKRAVVTLTETIAEEVKGTGITANAIAPSIIVTPANVESMPDAKTDGWVTPAEIAGLILALCAEDAGSVNGNTIRVFGAV